MRFCCGADDGVVAVKVIAVWPVCWLVRSIWAGRWAESWQVGKLPVGGNSAGVGRGADFRSKRV